MVMTFPIVFYDVTIRFAKKDLAHADGKLMNIFDAGGTRKK